MKKVTLTFVGNESDMIAEKFYHWVVDGGLEDGMIETLSTNTTTVEGIIDFNNENLEIAIKSKEAKKSYKNLNIKIR